MTRILIVDDHGVLRAGLRALLQAQPEMEVVGEASGGADALRLALDLCPDVVLMDISMPDLDGIQVTRLLVKHIAHVRVFLLTLHEEEALLREAIQAGAAGYMTKRAVGSELIDAIRSVAAGDLYIHPSMTRALLNSCPKKVAEEGMYLDQLTPRESQVLQFIASGYNNRQMAEALQLSVRTVESHRANLMAKLGLRGRVELVQYAAKHGLLRA